MVDKTRRVLRGRRGYRRIEPAADKWNVPASCCRMLFRVLGFIPIDDNVPGGPAGGDDVRFSILVQVSDFQVFTGHVAVVDDRMPLPGVAPLVEGDVEPDADI